LFRCKKYDCVQHPNLSGCNKLTDTIYSGAGDDTIYAGGGNNVINAGTGNDTVYLGSGNDKIILEGGKGSVTVIGFDVKSDKLRTCRLG
jgi:Ca2+-binding RTX toxin-like protein